MFEFDPAGPHAQWTWIRKDGVRLGRFAVRPLEEYRAAAPRPPPSDSLGSRDPSPVQVAEPEALVMVRVTVHARAESG